MKTIYDFLNDPNRSKGRGTSAIGNYKYKYNASTTDPHTITKGQT